MFLTIHKLPETENMTLNSSHNNNMILVELGPEHALKPMQERIHEDPTLLL